MKSSVTCCAADDSLGGDGFTALGARLLTALLALFVVAKVQEKLEKFGKGSLDVVRGVLISLAVLGLVYRYGVRPMIEDSRKGVVIQM